MFLTHWLELSGVDRLMAPVSDEDHASASHGPEEQESSELAFWSVVAPRSSRHRLPARCRKAMPMHVNRQTAATERITIYATE